MNEDNSSFRTSASANLAILEKLQGLGMARAIHVAVRLGLPDLLGSGRKRLSELALATNSSEEALYRLLRCLKQLGVIAEISPGFFAGTPLSERLQRERSDSLYCLSMLYGDEWQLRAWERLEDCIRNGRSGMSYAFGSDLWTYLDQHPASAELYNQACRDRISVAAGDFFESVPPGGDCYVLKQVLHDWDDPRASAILKSCRRAMKPGAKLLIVELVIAEAGPGALFGSLMDLQMLVVHGGRERTKQEFAHLLATSGYELQGLITTSTPASIIEAPPL